jgi:hypothetical protein
MLEKKAFYQRRDLQKLRQPSAKLRARQTKHTAERCSQLHHKMMNMNKLLFAFIIIVVTTRIAVSQNTPDTIKVDHYKTLEFDCAIFPSTNGELISGIKFTPTRDEIDEAESALKSHLKEMNHKLINQPPIIHKNLKHYKRQYFGYLDKAGQRILFINCFWSSQDDYFDENWLKSMIYVLDGGSYFWNVKYNLDTGELFELHVNGHA